jgi:hypothetical protein
LLRHNPKVWEDLADRQADALLYVQGKTPLHLRLAAYDRFDGITWHEAEYTRQPCFLRKDRDPRWLQLGRSLPNFLAGTESHQIKVGLLKTRQLPTPAHLERFRMGRVNRPDFFGWAQEEILQLPQRKIPSSTLFETECRTVDPRPLRKMLFATPHADNQAGYLQLPKDKGIDPAVAELARKWASDTPRGWAQVEAVVARLRAWCIHDREARIPHECRDTVAYFLFQARRGPDYAFTSAAALLLHALDYPTRVVSGFYVSPDRYDRWTRHTPVLAEGAHFWVEVLLPSGVWVAIEPTPGYELMGPTLPWTERLWLSLVSAGHWAQQHVFVLGVGLAVLAVLYWFRREVSDRLATLLWWAVVGQSWRQCVLQTVKLVEQRADWAGCPRPSGKTLSRWYGPVMAAAPREFANELERLICLADWAAHAPDGEKTRRLANERDVYTACRRVVRGWTLGRFRDFVRSSHTWTQ